MTTRPPRPGETDGVDYRFVDDEAFRVAVENGALLEWAEFGGHCYGTPWEGVRASLAAGRTVVLEIDVQGALQVRAHFPDALLVFLQPPDPTALRARLERRGTDSTDRIAERLKIADWEFAQAGLFDHEVVNDRVDAAVARIASILDSTAAGGR